MRNIHVESLSLVDFGVYEDIHVDFPKDTGLFLITGRNLDDTKLGANGVGKSTLWNGLAWVLYGTTPEGHRTSEVARGTRPGGSVVLRIDDVRTTVSRLGAPLRAYIGDKPCAEADIVQLCGLSRSEFFNAVLFGQQVDFWADLSVPERGAVLSEALKLDYWERLQKIAAEWCAQITANEAGLKLKETRIAGQISGLTSDADFDRQERAWQMQKDEGLLNIRTEIKTLGHNARLFQNALAAILVPPRPPAPPDTAILHRNLGKLSSELAQAGKSLDTLKSEIAATEQDRICPVCHRPWASPAKHEHLASLHVRIEDANASVEELTQQRQHAAAAVHEAESAVATHAEEHEKFHTAVRESDRAKMQLVTAQKEIAALHRRYEKAAEQESPYAAERARVAVLRTELEEAHKSLVEELYDTAALKAVASYWVSGFRILRIRLLERQCAALAHGVNSAAASLGLEGWHVQIVTETETKSGSTKYGVQILIQDARGRVGSWRTWSGGERQRARLALAVGLSSFLQRAAAVRWRLEVWDEPSSWLSEEGIEELLAHMHRRADSTGTQIWLADHRALAYSGFGEVWTAVREGGKSTIVRN